MCFPTDSLIRFAGITLMQLRNELVHAITFNTLMRKSCMWWLESCLFKLGLGSANPLQISHSLFCPLSFPSRNSTTVKSHIGAHISRELSLATGTARSVVAFAPPWLSFFLFALRHLAASAALRVSALRRFLFVVPLQGATAQRCSCVTSRVAQVTRCRATVRH
jgi:hypothetical protein